MRLVLVDCYDSFTHNLEQAFWMLGATVEVVRCDAVNAESLLQRSPDRVVLGPGPGRPEDAGCLLSAVRSLAGQVPLLGVCLGHQAIALAFGGQVVRHLPVHGYTTPISHDGTSVFRGVTDRPEMTRYHSLVVDPHSLPSCLRVTAWAPDGTIQGLTHRSAPVHGIQFHPESVLSGASGLQVLDNFLRSPQTASEPVRVPVHRVPAG